MNNKLLHGDCLEEMKKILDGSVEDVLTDIKNRIKVYHSGLDQDKQ